jgi:hypothetical protein
MEDWLTVYCHIHPDRPAAARRGPMKIGESPNTPICYQCVKELPRGGVVETWPVNEIRIPRDTFYWR